MLFLHIRDNIGNRRQKLIGQNAQIYFRKHKEIFFRFVITYNLTEYKYIFKFYCLSILEYEFDS